MKGKSMKSFEEVPETKKDKKRKPRRNRSNSRNRSNNADANYGNRSTSTNHIEWYVRDQQLLRDVGSLNFATPLKSDLFAKITRNTGAMASTGGIPGIMTLSIAPTYGISTGPESALNIASRQIFDYLRAEISGSRTYDAPNLMSYLISCDSAFIFYAHLLRAYSIMLHYTFLNGYTPRSLVEAMGFSYDSLSDMSRFRSIINLYAKKLSVLMVPNSMTVFERHSRMFGNVYKDSPNAKAQYYMYVPRHIYCYDPTGQDGYYFREIALRNAFNNVDTANPVVDGNLLTLDNIQGIIDDIMVGLNDEDFITISGDILKGFGSAGIWQQAYIPDNFQMEPVFDIDWLTQVQNAQSLNISESNLFDYSIQEVTPDPTEGSPYIAATCNVTKNAAAYAYSPYNTNYLLTLPYDDPTPEHVMRATRLMLDITATHNSTGSTLIAVNQCGSEIVTNISIFYFGSAQVGQPSDGLYRDTYVTWSHNSDAVSSLRIALDRLSMVSKFNMHPTSYLYWNVKGTTNPTAEDDWVLRGIDTDLDNFAYIDARQVGEIHDVAIMNMLYVRNAAFAAPKM